MAYDFGLPVEIGTGNNGVYSQTLCGSQASKDNVPSWTAEAAGKPFVVMEDPKTKKRIGFNKYHLARGLLLLGRAGAGKTNVDQILVSAIIRTMEEGSILFINDTKGDYFEEHGHSLLGNQMLLLGSGQVYKEITKFWNMFAEVMPRGRDGRLVYTEETDIEVMELCAQLFEGMKSETQPVFPAMAKQILAAMMIYYIRKHWYTSPWKLNNKDFLAFMLRLTADAMKEILEEEGMEDYRSTINYIHGGKSGNQSQGVLSYVNTILREVFIGPFAGADPNREFSVRELFEGNQKKVFFLEYDLVRGETLAPVYTLLIDLFLKHGLGGRLKKRKDFYLVIDEWAVLKSRLKHMSDALAFGRSQGLKVCAGLQNISAIESIYGEAEAKNILAGFQNIIGFNVTDQASRQFLAERSGKNYVNYSFSAQNANLNTQKESYGIPEWEIQRLACGEAMVKMADEEPFIFTFPAYQGKG